MVDFGNLMDIQRNIASRIASDTTMDESIKLLSVIQELNPDGSGWISKEAVILEAVAQGMLRAQAEVLLRQLIRDKSLSESDGYVSLE